MGTVIAEIDPICENEVGAAYGSCHAFCTAMDCDGESQASDVACQKVKEKYVQVTGNASLPCEPPPLPPCNEIIGGGFCSELPCNEVGSFPRDDGYCEGGLYCCDAD